MKAERGRGRRRSRGGLRAGGALLAALLAAPAAAQSFLDAYKAGIAASEAGDWARVESSMRVAIGGRPEENRRLPLQLHFKPYLPHFYLGLALAEQGACEEALEAFVESDRQGVVQTLPDEHAVLQTRRQACEARLAADSEARRREVEAGDLVARARAAVEGAGRLVPDAEAEPDLAQAWERGEPSLAARLEEARSHLQRAERALAEAGRREGGLAAAGDLAQGVLAQVETIRREAELREQTVGAEKARAEERLEGLRSAARDLLGRSEELAAKVAAVGRRRAALEGTLRRTAGAGPGLPLAELGELAGRIEHDMAGLRSAAEPPPEPLLAAADAWLRGEPEAVLAALGGPRPAPEAGPEAGLGFREPRARAHALLLRGAAAFALYQAGGGRDPELLEAARLDLEECRRTDPSVEPVPRAFSPRFRAFFEQAAGAEAPGTADD